MRSPLQPKLVNGPFEDPGLYVELIHGSRAFLFDMGDLASLSVRQVLRVTDVFVSHTHMDHWEGFDRALRLWLGRDKVIRLFGPEGFVERVEHKLGAYTWNLVEGYENHLEFVVSEVGENGGGRQASFVLREAFRRREQGFVSFLDGVLLDEDNLEVRATVLDHGIPCLAFAIRERWHVNVFKNRLEELALGKGPWLNELKRLVLDEAPDGTEIVARWRIGDEPVERRFTLGWLKREILNVVPGQKFTYVTDVAWTERNVERIVELAHGSEILFIEAAFLDRERAHAAAKRHLTARQAGTLARLAGVTRVVPFHLSPRHEGEEHLIRAELEAAFRGG